MYICYLTTTTTTTYTATTTIALQLATCIEQSSAVAGAVQQRLQQREEVRQLHWQVLHLKCTAIREVQLKEKQDCRSGILNLIRFFLFLW